MVRKGWLVMELRADGWVKVLRGRRPVSEQWPMASKNSTKVETEKNSRGRWRQRSQVCQDKVRRSLEAALGGLGPEDLGAMERIQEVLRRAMEGRHAVHVNPDIVKAEAVAKVEFWLKQVLSRCLLRSTPQCLVGDGFRRRLVAPEMERRVGLQRGRAFAWPLLDKPANPGTGADAPQCMRG